MGDEGANLEIAKLYLQDRKEQRRAVHHLELVCRSQQESEATIEEAQRLLKVARQGR
jgi:hypothetical protein